MTDRAENRVSEAPQTFQAATEVGSLVPRTGTWRAKVFKSGNSLALRLPKALGLQAGLEMDLSALQDGSIMLRRIDLPRRKIDISGFAGKMPGIRLAPREDFEERPSTIAARKAAGLL